MPDGATPGKLPCKSPAPAPIFLAMANSGYRDLRVLFFCEAETWIEGISAQLPAAGLSVSHAHVANLPDLRAALGRETWDLILADYSLAGLPGRAALMLAREMGVAAPFIAVAEEMDADERRAFTRAGGQAVVLPGDHLIPILEEHLDFTAREIVVFDRDEALERFEGYEPLVDNVIVEMIRATPEQLIELSRAVAQKDAPAIELLSHSIKGAAAMVGAHRVREAARALEEIGRSRRLTAAPAALHRLEEEAAILLEHFRRAA